MIAFKLALSLLFVASNVFADDNDEGMACLALFENFGEHCCESVEKSETFEADMKSCPVPSGDDVSCESFKCMLDKQGIMKGDNIDEDAARERLQKVAKEHVDEKQMTERIMRECLDGKYQEYPPEDACPALKFFTCTLINAHLGCTQWKSSDKCNKLAENAKKCRELVDQ